jgi:uncharacterized protein YcbK (DUF882 family)
MAVNRRFLLGLMSGFVAVAAAPVYAKAPGLIRKAGDIRRVHLVSPRTGETINTVYWVDGEYIPEAMNEISFFMRDWRENMLKPFDPHTVDIMAAAHNKLGTEEPYLVISGYRSKATNDMLRRTRRGVATNSYHIKAMAVDLRLRSRNVAEICGAARSCDAGGVGRYTRANFVHMDSGPVRTWGR